MRETSRQCTHNWRSGKVRRRSGLVALHDRQPALVGRKVGSDGRLAVREDFERLLGHDSDGEAGRGAETFLGRANDNVNSPVVHADLLRCDGADTVEDDDGRRAL